MKVSQVKLDEWCKFAEHVKIGTYILLDAFNTGDKSKFVTVATGLHNEAAHIAQSVQETEFAGHEALPLSRSLNVLDTPLSRDYARVLEIAAEAALVVDHERGLGDHGPAQFQFLELARLNAEISGTP